VGNGYYSNYVLYCKTIFMILTEPNLQHKENKRAYFQAKFPDKFKFLFPYQAGRQSRFHEKACQPIVRRGERLLSVIPNVTLPSAFFYELSHKLDALHSPSWKLQPCFRSLLCHWLMTDLAEFRSLPDGTLSLGSYK